MEPWVWPVLLLVLGLGLAVLEVFFASAGILAFFSAACLLAAIFLGFRQGPVMGLVVLGIVVVGAPTIIILAFRWWPYTSMGKQVLLEAPTAKDVLPDDPERHQLKSMIGHIGRAACPMLPGGVVSVDGRTVDAVSEGTAIELGQRVRVVKVEANRLVVRPIEGESLSESAENPLERPIDDIDDPFDDARLDKGTNKG
jgi:membrane-bound ClpP family serine protease